ncbi:gliding motility-associated peptidyl-prolyl isomerase GldI [Psychroflexus maritimus]|uniref:Peptidyl-prolyl cis-trans isomerase n=1 Tax=Psychroflexus maritimus TaxID=2714865 RepID=A0A967AEM9_9FLAO|nr:gliding motility-associated peptidyl-prolyl isomerase GldI [Psychroflexus maritimus]NGZ90158.1 gliding motility-associated peptidyl-prolyl isomerase GldI [Psychroflexus maritimus]
MKKKLIIIALIGVNLISCQTPEEPRKPISQQSGSYMKESSERNRKIAKKEKEAILSLIKKDSLLEYNKSENGFWYAYLEKNENDTITPKKGDQVIFTYNILDLSGNEIYSKEELGEKEYYIDEEVIFSGLRLGLKLMKEKEKASFIFQSFKAFGTTGDREKIPPNTPIQVNLELIEINPK